MTWLRASMCVSALPWMFMPIWSMANDSPSPGALSPVCVIVCRAGSGLSAVTRYSMGQANDTDRRGALNYHTPATMLAAVGEVKLGRSVSLACPIEYRVTADNPEPARHTMTQTGDKAPGDGLSFAMDQIGMNIHGNADTHIDALSHVIYDGRLY